MVSLDRALRGLAAGTVLVSTYGTVRAADAGGPETHLLFVGSVAVLGVAGVAGLVRGYPLAAVGPGAILAGAGVVQFLPAVSVAGATLLVAGVASFVPRPAGATP